MGLLAKHLGQPDAGILDAIQRAYADEWFAHYNYFFVAHMVGGPSSESVSGLLREKSDAALVRADRLALRLIQLGGEPASKLTSLVDHATDKPFKLPEDFGDVNGLLSAVLDAERTSIRTLHGIYEAARERDPVTAALALDLLGESMRGEQQMERLLGDEVPHLDGA